MMELWRRIAARLRWRSRQRVVDEELNFHLEIKAREPGHRNAADRAPRGGALFLRERDREAWGRRWLDDLAWDVRYALRLFGRNPGFTTVVVVMLGAGIGMNAAVFTITNAVLFKGFRGVVGNGRLLYIGTQKDGRGCCVSYPDFVDWRAQTRSFLDLGAVADLQINVTDSSGAPEHYDATEVTANTFGILETEPILGRGFVSADEARGAAPVAILSYGFWQRRYGGDPAVIGRTIRVNGIETAVVGVMPRGFSFPQNQDLWLPLVPAPELEKRSNRQLWFAFGRLADGATIDGARAELDAIGRRLATAYPETNEGWIPTPRTFARFFIGVDAPIVYGVLWGAVGFLMLIACANFSNLVLARASGRARETAVRVALGAGRWRIGRQFVLENLLLSSAGGVLGWWLAGAAVRLYELTANPPTRIWSEHLLDYALDHRVLVYVVALTVGAGVVVGLVPAAAVSGLDVNGSLKDGTRGATEGRRGKHAAALLVASQVALSVVLIAGAGVMIRSFLNLYSADLGARIDGIVTALVSLPADKYREPIARVSFFDRLESRVAMLPGVESVTMAGTPPASGAARMPYEAAGTLPVDEQRRPTVSVLTIGPAYFRTMGTSVSGREFTDADGVSGVAAIVVNRQFAASMWPGEEPLGKRVRLFDANVPGPWLTVVGVAGNIVQDISRQRRDPIVYVPYRVRPAPAMWVFARTRGNPANLAPAFQREVLALDPDLPVWIGPYPLSQRLAGSGAYWSIRTDAILLLAFAVTGLLLASVGLYAVVAHGVSRRTQEIGVRTALGATSRDIVALVVRSGAPPVLGGLGAGLVLSVAVTRLLASELIRVSPADPLTEVVTSLILLTFAALGCAVPTRRAMRVDPVVALKHE